MATVKVISSYRPKRLAFLVNLEECNDALLDAIWKYNLSVWGGRYNPIVPTDGKSIKEEWWRLLELTDPDVIHSFASLEPNLVDSLHKRIAPYDIKCPYPHEQKDIRKGDIRIVQTEEAVGVFSLIRQLQQYRRLIDDPIFGHIKDVYPSTTFSRFLHRNFGTLTDVWAVKKLLETVPHETFDPKTYDIQQFIERTTHGHGSYRFLIEICALEAKPPQIKHVPFESWLYLVVGNTPEHAIFAWNSVFLRATSTTYGDRVLWIPEEYGNDPDIFRAIVKWIREFLWLENEHHAHACIVSSTLNSEYADQLKKITQEVLYLPVKSVAPTFPNVEPEEYPYDVPRPGHVSEEKSVEVRSSLFSIPRPSFLDSHENGEWMVDTHIAFHPERFQNTNKQYWWLLPRRAYLARNFFEQRPGRITKNGLPSYLAKGPDANLTISIPDERWIFHFLLVDRWLPYYTSTPKPNLQPSRTKDIGISDKGAYLRGLIDLFGSLHAAGQFLGSKYWRQYVFGEMIRQNYATEESREAEIKNWLKKTIVQSFPVITNDEKVLGRLSKYLLRKAKELPKVTREIDLEFFVKQLRRSRERETPSGYAQEFEKELDKKGEQDLLRDVQGLVDDGVLLMGLRPQCRRCGSSFWYPIEEIKQKISCYGCKNIINLSVNAPWYFRLNYLAEGAIKFHGVVPVLLALVSLEWESKVSFYYIPGQNLYTSYNAPNSFAEVDVLYVQDGKFWLGEVKTDSGDLNQSDVDTLVELSKEILPDGILIATMNSKQPTRFTELLKKLEEEVRRLNVEVKHLSLADTYFTLDTWHYFKPVQTQPIES